jgi:hypothetical protein
MRTKYLKRMERAATAKADLDSHVQQGRKELQHQKMDRAAARKEEEQGGDVDQDGEESEGEAAGWEGEAHKGEQDTTGKDKVV